MRAWIVMVTVLSACQPRHEPAPELVAVTTAQAEAFGKELEKAITAKPCNEGAVTSLFDADLITQRALANRKLPGTTATYREEARSACKMLCQLPEGTTVKYLHTITIDGRPKPVLRLVGLVGVNYYIFELDRRGGETKAADQYVIATGENLSDTLGNLLEQAYADGPDSPLRALVTSIPKIRDLMFGGKPDEARRILTALPASIRDHKLLLLLEITLESSADNEPGMLDAIKRFEAKYPGDPALELVSVDAAYLRKKYDDVLVRVDRLDKRIGGDPYLDVIRANAHLLAGRPARAIEVAKRGTEKEPALESLWWSLLTAQAKSSDFQGAAATLEVLRTRFNAALDPSSMATDERFTVLVASKPYLDWWQAHKPR
jgi:hypothetical protein